MDRLHFEHLRRQALRTFRVFTYESPGTYLTVTAHYWESSSAAGHANFFTIEPSGRHVIHDCLNCSLWARIKEVENPEADQAMMLLITEQQQKEPIPTPAPEKPSGEGTLMRPVKYVRPAFRKRGGIIH